jgi:hypothetical protein
LNGFSKYGEVTVVYSPDVLFEGQSKINQRDPINNVYSSDIYSSTFPDIKYDLINKNIWKLYDTFEKDMIETKEYNSDWEYRVNKGRDDCIDHLRKSVSVKFNFVKNNGLNEIKVPKKEVKFREPIFNTKSLKNFLMKSDIGINLNNNDLVSAVEKGYKELIKENKDSISTSEMVKRWKKEYKEEIIDEKNKNIIVNEGENSLSNSFLNEVYATKKILDNGKYAVDTDKLNIYLSKYIQKKDLTSLFEDFINKNSDFLYENPHIKMGSKKIACNEENIIKYIKSEGVLGGEKSMVFGLGRTKHQFAKKMTSLKDIFNSKELFTTSEEYEKKSLENKDILFEITDELSMSRNHGYDTFELNDYASEYLGKIQFSDLPEKINMQLIKNGFEKSTIELAEKFKKLSSSLREEKVPYFEAKPLRNVKTSEIKCLIMPKGLRKELKNELSKMGIDKIFYYNKKDNQDRIRALGKAEKYSLNEKYVDNIKAKSSNTKKIR